jgi:cell division protein FtsB
VTENELRSMLMAASLHELRENVEAIHGDLDRLAAEQTKIKARLTLLEQKKDGR